MPEAYATKFDLPLDHVLVKMLRFEEHVSAAFADHIITTNDLHKEALVEHGIPANKNKHHYEYGNDDISIRSFRPSRALAWCWLTMEPWQNGWDWILSWMRSV